MTYVVQAKPDESFLWMDGTRGHPLITLVDDRDPVLRLHVTKDGYDDYRLAQVFYDADGEGVHVGDTTHWHREAVEAVITRAEILYEKTAPEEVERVPGAMVYLTDVGPKKIYVIKVIREMHQLHLSQCKAIVDAVAAGESYCLGTSPPIEWLEYLLEAGATTINVLPPTVWDHLDQDD